MSLALYLALSLVIFIFYKYYRHTRTLQRCLCYIPMPPGLPYVGHVLHFTNPKDYLKELMYFVANHGGFLKFHFFQVYTLIITDVDKIEKMLGSTKILNKSLEYAYFHRWLGEGLLTSEPAKWRITRKMLTPTFHFQILEQFIDVYNKCAAILVEKLEEHADEKIFDVYPFIALGTLDVICETAMGTSVNAQLHSNSDYVKSVQTMNEIIMTRFFSPYKRFDFIYYFTSEYRKEKRALKTIHGHTESVIDSRRRALTSKRHCNGINQESNGMTKGRLAFLDLLLQCEIDGRPLTNEEIRNEVDTFMFEGHDTTASAIAFALYCLSQNRNIQQLAFEELQTIFNHNKHEYVSQSHLQQMKYLEKVIKETLRLYPSVPLFARQLQEDAEFDGHIIPKGVTLTTFAYGMHRDPKLYPDPEKFDPERFNPERQALRSPFAYVPFSAGPRNCIGQRFAMLEMKTTLSYIIRHFEILPAKNYEPVLVPNVILKSLNGVEICLRKRDL